MKKNFGDLEWDFVRKIFFPDYIFLQFLFFLHASDLKSASGGLFTHIKPSSKYKQNFRNSAGTKIEISPLRNMIETSGFFHYTHICNSNKIERSLENLTVLKTWNFNLTPQIGPLDLLQNRLQSSWKNLLASIEHPKIKFCTFLPI
jgi:hypothetical protein